MDSRRKGNAVSMAVLVTVVAVLFALIVVGLRQMDLIRLPGFIEKLFYSGGGNPEILPGDDGRIYEALRGGGPGPEAIAADIAEADARALLGKAGCPEALHVRAESIYYDGGRPLREIKIEYYIKNDKFRYATHEDGQAQLLVINDGKNESVRHFAAGDATSGRAPASFGPDSIPLAPDAAVYTRPGGPVELVSSSLYNDGTYNVLLLILSHPSLSQTEELYVALDYGVVAAILTYSSAGALVYEYKTTLLEYEFAASGGNAIPDSLFAME